MPSQQEKLPHTEKRILSSSLFNKKKVKTKNGNKKEKSDRLVK